MTSGIAVAEGKMPFAIGGETFETYYKVFGDLKSSTRTPLVVLHGGPGIAHDYMTPLGDLSLQSSTAVILYDQIGCASANRPTLFSAVFSSLHIHKPSKQAEQ